MSNLEGSAYFLAGWLTCAVMSGALLMLAVHTYVEEDDRDNDDE